MITKRKPALDDKRILLMVKNQLIPLSSNPPDSFRLSDLRKRLSEGSTFVSRTSRGRCNGFLHLIIANKMLWVDMLAVRAASQRRGIGQRLLRFAERRGKAKGFAKMSLMVDRKNEGGIRFYTRNGYQSTRYVHEADCYVMEKQLDSQKPFGPG